MKYEDLLFKFLDLYLKYTLYTGMYELWITTKEFFCF